jgi:hypothetical protein
MNHISSDTQEFEESLLFYNIDDETIEIASGAAPLRSEAFTLSFCSGLDTCPA